MAEKEKKRGGRTQQATHLFDRASIGQDGSQRIKKPSKAPAANQLAGDKGREIRKGERYLDLSLRIGIDPVDGKPRTGP